MDQLKTVNIKVDNRMFILGLDYLFRHEQKKYEGEKLLAAARSIKDDLNMELREYPVEGYYTESESLKEYFQIIRNLQQADLSRQNEIKSSADFDQLLAYTGSRIFGTPVREKLLPVCVNPLATALAQTYPDWNVENLVSKAYAVTAASDDYSLTGLACLSRDPVTMTAVRESVVLYSDVPLGAVLIKKVYEWAVDGEIEKRANIFIREFNTLTGSDIPEANAQNAAIFAKAMNENEILYRCVNIGRDEKGIRFYHWAINMDNEGNYKTDDFWDDTMWTTQKYRDNLKKKIDNQTP